MLRTVRLVAVSAFLAAATVLPSGIAAAEDGVHRLALQISDNDPATMTKVLNVAANTTRDFTSKGEEIEIEIVAFNAGLHMLRTDTSPVIDRINSFSQSMPNVTFQACGNTMKGMTKKEGKAPPLVAAAHVVPAGVVRLMELDEAGWTVLRP